MRQIGQLHNRAEPGDRQRPALDVDLRSEAGFPSSSSRKITTLRQTLSRGVFAAAAATGILSLSCSAALADSNAAGVTSDSPGVASGNNAQAPLDLPVNLCGNTANAVAALNGAFGNTCANKSCASKEESDDSTYGDSDDADDDDTSAYGSEASDDCGTPPPATTHPSTPQPPTRSSKTPPRKVTPPAPSRHMPPAAAAHEEPAGPPQLAQTGNTAMLATSAASVALITGGVMLYRRGRTASQR
jgi:hypothetical protein